MNTLFILYPERFITIWNRDPRSPTSPGQSYYGGQGYCGDPWYVERRATLQEADSTLALQVLLFLRFCLCRRARCNECNVAKPLEDRFLARTEIAVRDDAGFGHGRRSETVVWANLGTAATPSRVATGPITAPICFVSILLCILHCSRTFIVFVLVAKLLYRIVFHTLFSCCNRGWMSSGRALTRS